MTYIIVILGVLGLFIEYPVVMTVITISVFLFFGIALFGGATKISDKVWAVVAPVVCCFVILTFGWIAHGLDDTPASKSNKSSQTYIGTCIESGCDMQTENGSIYCYLHKPRSNSNSSSHSGSNATSSNSSSSSNSHGGSSNYNSHSSSSSHGGSSSSNHYYNCDPADYDTPEDYADDAWGDDFDDWDDAYDYWENY